MVGGFLPTLECGGPHFPGPGLPPQLRNTVRSDLQVAQSSVCRSSFLKKWIHSCFSSQETIRRGGRAWGARLFFQTGLSKRELLSLNRLWVLRPRSAFAQNFAWWLKRRESASSWSPGFCAPDPLLLVSCTFCAAVSYQNGTM